MTIALRPDEDERLAALASYNVMDTPRESDFDDIVRLASEICETPVAVVNLIGDGRQFFKAEIGLGVRETPLETSFCGHAILDDDFMIVPDATLDHRFDCNPLVTGDPGLRFYAGALLKTAAGLPIGTLCVLDFKPKDLASHQRTALRTLANQVMTQLELRRLNTHLAERVAEVEAERDRSEMLGREIDHRVMNSLQFVSGLLAMQAKTTDDREAAHQLGLASSRVSTVARVHRHFYVEEVAGTTSALAYAERLLSDLSDVIAPCSVRTAGQPTPIATALIMPLGLITNELVTNAAKNGAQRVEVRISASDGGVRIEVEDDGPGLPVDFDPAARKGLGLRVVRSLVDQHAGVLTFGSGRHGGALFSATLTEGS
ncbi:MAG: GAF domain-containing protein [Alphaproteobacteria bacterium]|jgi:two-component sensor histidine kinase|nr:GAF domain-containing protein [Alphaproteobacteria bacterium]MBU2043374.1 GAF domain-containing protein [Alphaproteobacteria bacterium]MBU2126772.1 GAF domain-containing protein [Alphaproteobacteria bacterium]MBU2207270.1 GAF domain-containing protein [Alphaproteobacteria bacterium]MBU2289813.1 GAF domain-containing protein [Alphaproteobacteria bacterium]